MGPNGFYSLLNLRSQQVIDLPAQCAYQNQCELQQWPSNGGPQQQWTLVPADAAGEFALINALSGKAMDLPGQCAMDPPSSQCFLWQYDSNGGWQQQWLFYPLVPAPPPATPPPGVTILVNGSFDDDPGWTNPSDPEYQAIAATFGHQPITYHWSSNSEVIPPYFDILNGGADFAAFVNSLDIAPQQNLNIVAHSHGGNVVNIASYSISHPINYMVNLGTPVNWDLAPIYLFSNITTHICQVSSLADEMQFLGASPLFQIYPFGVDQYSTAFWLTTEVNDIENGLYVDALYDASQVAYYEAQAFAWWMSTKLDPSAWNVIYSDYSHSDLHTSAVWQRVQHDCGLSN